MPAPKHFAYSLSFLTAALAGLPAGAFADSKTEKLTVIQSDEASAKEGEHAEARGHVVMTRDELKVESDWAHYDVPQDRLQAGDKVKVTKEGDVLTGSKLDVIVDPRKGDLLDPVFQMSRGNVRGDAVKIIFDGPDRYIARKSRMTTCAPGNDDWYLHSDTLDLDYNTNIFSFKDATGQIKKRGSFIEIKVASFLYYFLCRLARLVLISAFILAAPEP
jgi:LPS-assembly protein